MEGNAREPVLQHPDRRLPGLAEQLGVVTGPVQAELDAADPREEAGHPK